MFPAVRNRKVDKSYCKIPVTVRHGRSICTRTILRGYSKELQKGHSQPFWGRLKRCYGDRPAVPRCQVVLLVAAI